MLFSIPGGQRADTWRAWLPAKSSFYKISSYKTFHMTLRFIKWVLIRMTTLDHVNPWILSLNISLSLFPCFHLLRAWFMPFLHFHSRKSVHRVYRSLNFRFLWKLLISHLKPPEISSTATFFLFAEPILKPSFPISDRAASYYYLYLVERQYKKIIFPSRHSSVLPKFQPTPESRLPVCRSQHAAWLAWEPAMVEPHPTGLLLLRPFSIHQFEAVGQWHPFSHFL